jgi:hypothetical protein
MSELRYVRSRQTAHLAGLGDSEIEKRLAALVQTFDKGWLDREDGEPLQKLWSRRDGLATSQLVLIGDAICSLLPINSKWLSDQIRKIKSGDQNNRRGAMFELLGLNLLGGSSVTPTPPNYPGYDAIVTTPDGAKLLVSLKSYGTSMHEQTFRTESAETEQSFLAAVKKLRISGLTLRAIAQDYPRPTDWKALRDALPIILERENYGRNQVHPVEKTWAFSILHNPPPEVLPLSTSHLSYQVNFIAPYHNNESKNLFDKLDDAAANARKHAKDVTKDSAHAVMVRLPETISFAKCQEWAQLYVADDRNGSIDSVMLYQPSVVDLPNNTHIIDHAFFQCGTARYSTWVRPERVINISTVVGKFSSGTRRQLTGGWNLPDISQMYNYQHGEFYTVHDWKPNVPITFDINYLATGIFQHAVIKNESGEVVLAGVFPPQKALSLFD